MHGTSLGKPTALLSGQKREKLGITSVGEDGGDDDDTYIHMYMYISTYTHTTFHESISVS